MTILITAMALAAAPAATAVQPTATPAHAMHAQQAQPAQSGAKPQAEGCSCCKAMGGGGKMGCCAKHGEAEGAEHSGHKANR